MHFVKTEIPSGAKRALTNHVNRAFSRLDPARYRQEPAYVSGFFSRLDGVIYDRKNLKIEIRSTIVADRGPKSAEYKWGADFAITSRVETSNGIIEKAVLGQAKIGSLLDLSPAGRQDFSNQVSKMSKATDSMIGFEVPMAAGVTPTVRILDVPYLESGVPIWKAFRAYESYLGPTDVQATPIGLGEPLPVGRYLHSELLRCLHGDRNEDFVSAVSDSSLTRMNIQVSRR